MKANVKSNLSMVFLIPECTSTSMKEMLNINVVALVLCTKLSVKSMMDRKVTNGHIVNINR